VSSVTNIQPKTLTFTHEKFNVTIRYDIDSKTWEWEAIRVPKPKPIFITGMGMKSSEQARKDAIKQINKLVGEN
jgi:hypothetical protein